MTAREWQPGDVAMVTSDDGDTWIAIVRPRKAANGALEFVYTTGGFDMVGELAEGYTARPLVTIDPEDREQVERFREIASRWADQVPYSDMREPGDMDHTDAMQAALREFADPKPKPDEPTGLGAVVVDTKGRRYTRATAGRLPWIDLDSCAYGWDEFTAVEVLSDGVQP